MITRAKLPEGKLIVSTEKWYILFNDRYCTKKIFDLIEEVLSRGSIPESWIRLNSSKNSIVWKFRVDDEWFIFKEYCSRSKIEGLKALIRGTRAERAWRNGNLLTDKGIVTPPLVLLGKRFYSLLNYKNFLITKFIPNAVGVHTFLRESLYVPLTKEKILFKRYFIRQFASFVGKLHAKGIAHGDLRLDNILIIYENKDKIKFILIDNEKNKYFQKDISFKLRLKNLVQLNMITLPTITLTDRMRFFKTYLAENPSCIPFKKKIIRKVILKTQKRLRKRQIH